MNIRIVFMGSPDFALPALAALDQNFSLVGVVTQPDRPAGRGRELTPPPVKVLAQELGLPVIQPANLRQPEALEQLQTWDPEIIVVAAFGQILRPNVLDLPPHGCVNVHASLLPRWRGAAPVQAAILHGDKTTGVTIMKMDPGVDTGPILAQKSIPIDPLDNAGTSSPKLAQLGADLLVEILPSYVHGEIEPEPQDNSQATYAPMLKKSDGELDFSETAEVLARKVRAYNPWPGTFTFWKNQRLKIHRAHPVMAQAIPPGKTTIYQDLPAIGTGSGLLVLDEVQPSGKKPMPGEVFLHGAKDWAEQAE
jgi:methionyl-tRNA formyltransferase